MRLKYHMLRGPYAGHSTNDVEQYLRWLSQIATVTPEYADKERAQDKADRDIDRVVDVAAAKFEDRG